MHEAQVKLMWMTTKNITQYSGDDPNPPLTDGSKVYRPPDLSMFCDCNVSDSVNSMIWRPGTSHVGSLSAVANMVDMTWRLFGDGLSAPIIMPYVGRNQMNVKREVPFVMW